MKLYYHMSIPYLSNTYLVSAEDRGAALLIDPGTMDVPLLNMVEGNGYYIRSILITRAFESHVNGIKTILRIYEADIYSANHSIDDIPCRVIGHGDQFTLHGLPIEVFGAHAFCRDAVFFKIRNALFTGDVLTAGTPGGSSERLQQGAPHHEDQRAFRRLGRNDQHLSPATVRPSTVRIERLYNQDLQAQT